MAKRRKKNGSNVKAYYRKVTGRKTKVRVRGHRRKR